MKTRDQIYHREGEKLLRFLTTYHALKYEQVMKMFGNQDSIKSLITSLVKQGRIYHDKEAGLLCDSPEAAKNPDRGTIAAFWVLLDFEKPIVFHTSGDFPVKLHFFSENEEYEILYVPLEQEILVDHVMKSIPLHDVLRLVVLENIQQVRSEVTRRLRLYQKAETYLTLLSAGIPFFADQKPDIFREGREAGILTMGNLPLFYSSREFKHIGSEATKIRNSRSMGVLLAPHCAYALYNTGDHVLKWEYRTEVRLNAFLQHYLQDFPYTGHPKVRAILTGKDMDTAYQLLTSTGGYKKSLFVADTSYEHFHYLPNTPEGETLLKLLVRPRLMKHLDQLLLSDLGSRQPDLPIDHDGVDASGNPAVLAYDFDLHRINRFNTGLNVYGRKGVMICFDFQIPCLKRYLTADIRFSSIDLSKFRKGFLHEP